MSSSIISSNNKDTARNSRSHEPFHDPTTRFLPATRSHLVGRSRSPGPATADCGRRLSGARRPGPLVGLSISRSDLTIPDPMAPSHPFLPSPPTSISPINSPPSRRSYPFKHYPFKSSPEEHITKKVLRDGQLHRFAEAGDVGRRRRLRRLGIRDAQTLKKASRASGHSWHWGEDEDRGEVDGDQDQDKQEATGGAAEAGERGGLAAAGSSRRHRRDREALEAEATKHTGSSRVEMRCALWLSLIFSSF